MECPIGSTPFEEVRVLGVGAGLFAVALTAALSLVAFAALSCATRTRQSSFCGVLLANLALALCLVLLPKGKCRREVPTFGVNRQGQFLDITVAVAALGFLAAVALLAKDAFVPLAAIPRDERLAGVAAATS